MFDCDTSQVHLLTSRPEVLSRYNILLSQTHSLSNTMTGANADSIDFTGPFANPNNALKQLSLHPSAASHPADQDNVLGVLLRTKQIPEIEKEEERLANLQTKEGDDETLIDELVGQIRAHDKAVQEAHDHIVELRDQTEWAGRLEDTEAEEEQEQSTSLEDLLRFVSSGSVGR